MVETERRGIALPRMPQGRRHGASSAGQQGSDDQALDFTPKPALNPASSTGQALIQQHVGRISEA